MMRSGRVALGTGLVVVAVMGLATWTVRAHRQLVHVGDLLPAMNLSEVSGKQVNIANLRGKPVIINFFTTWCGPCQQEAPMLQRAAQQWAGKIQFVMIDRGESQHPVEGFISQYHITDPLVLLDSNDTWAPRLLVTGQPETFYVNAQGVVIDHVNHELTEAELQDLIHQALRTHA